MEFSSDGLSPKPSGQKRFSVLFCSQIQICFILQSAPSPRASEDWKSGKCTGVYRQSSQHSSHNFLTMSLKKAIPDCPSHHNPHFDGRDRKLRIAGSVFHPETVAISFSAGMQSEQYVATQRTQELLCLCKYRGCSKRNLQKKEKKTEIHFSVLAHSVSSSRAYPQSGHRNPILIH